MIKLYGHEISGNVYKVRLLLALLNLDYEYIRVDLLKGEHKSPEYLKLNSFGQVPLLVDGEQIIADSQAILVYLARKYGNEQWLPIEAESLSQVVRWLSTTAGEIRQGVEHARLFHLLGPTIADIAAFPYIALASDGKVSLEPYPHILSWIERIKKLPNFVDMSEVVTVADV